MDERSEIHSALGSGVAIGLAGALGTYHVLVRLPLAALRAGG